jgi:putative ABC transport system substrate-binding protein
LAILLAIRTMRQREERAALLAAARIVEREIIMLECSATSDFKNAFSTLAERHANAVIVSAFLLAFNNRHKILDLAVYHKIPAIYPQRQYVYEGGLMSYNAASAMHQLAIEYVARILKGEKPADLPIRRPSKFQLIVNRKTAKTLGLEIPPILMVMADQIIQ